MYSATYSGATKMCTAKAAARGKYGAQAFYPSGHESAGSKRSAMATSTMLRSTCRGSAAYCKDRTRSSTRRAISRGVHQPVKAQESSESSGSEKFAFGLPGSIPPVKNFDPLGLSKTTENEVRRYREAELVHGRLSMLAVLGFLAGENLQVFFPNDVTNKLAIDQFQQVPRPFEGILVLAIGVAESIRARIGWVEPSVSNFRLFQLRKEYNPGDLGFDPLNLAPSDEKTFETRQNQELSHGRLAMVTIFGFIVQELKFGTPIVEQFKQVRPHFQVEKLQ